MTVDPGTIRGRWPGITFDRSPRAWQKVREQLIELALLLAGLS